MSQRPVGYLSKWQEFAISVFVCLVFAGWLAALVLYLVSLP